MKVLFKDDYNIKMTVANIDVADNGVKKIVLFNEDGNDVDVSVDNAVEFYSTDGDKVAVIFVDYDEGNDIINELLQNETVNLAMYSDRTIMFPSVEDLDFVEEIKNLNKKGNYLGY